MLRSFWRILFKTFSPVFVKHVKHYSVPVFFVSSFSQGSYVRFFNFEMVESVLFLRNKIIRAMAKIGYTRKPDGQKRVPLSTLVPGRHLIGQRPPRPDSGRIWNGSTRFWLLIPPSATRCQSHLPDYGRAIRPAAHTRTRHRVIAGRGGSFLRSTWSCVRQNFNFVVQSVCDAPIINTSYEKLPFGYGDYPDKLLFHQALN